MNKREIVRTLVIVVVLVLVLVASTGCASKVKVNQIGCPELSLDGVAQHAEKKAKELGWMGEASKYDGATITFLCGSAASDPWIEVKNRHVHLNIPVPYGATDAKSLVESAMAKVASAAASTNEGVARPEKEIQIQIVESYNEVIIELGDDLTKVSEAGFQTLAEMGGHMAQMHDDSLETFERIYFAEKAAQVVEKNAMGVYVLIAVIAAYLIFRRRD